MVNSVSTSQVGLQCAGSTTSCSCALPLAAHSWCSHFFWPILLTSVPLLSIILPGDLQVIDSLIQPGCSPGHLLYMPSLILQVSYCYQEAQMKLFTNPGDSRGKVDCHINTPHTLVASSQRALCLQIFASESDSPLSQHYLYRLF